MKHVVIDTAMARTVKKKTKLSGIMDNSTMGLSLGGAEMPMRKTEIKKLRKAIIAKGSLFEIEGNIKGEGECMATIYIDGEPVRYQFRNQGGNAFLNVTGNPAKLMTGSNSIPIILKDGEFSGNAIVNTFKYSNRILFALLEFIPDFAFRWQGQERKMLESGKFNISRLQYAWYSADLGSHRNNVLVFLRKCYNGQNSTKTKAYNLSKDLGFNVNAWDNHDGNLTLTGMAGDKKDFSLTLYAKDESPNSEKDSKTRLMSLIRFDGTFYDYFLKTHGIKQVVDLERKYEEVCNKSGYDIGFVRWLANYIYSRLKIEYVTKLNIDQYREFINSAKQIAEGKNLNEARLMEHWLSYGKTFDSVGAKCEELGVNPKKHSEYVANIRDKTGIDLDIPRTFHDAMLLNRIMGNMTEEERGDFLMNVRGNSSVRVEELMERDSEMVQDMSGLLSVEGLTRIRKMKPVILKSSDFWAYRKLRGE